MEVALAPDRSVAPSGWISTTIGDLADIQRGASPRPITDSKWFDSRSGVGWVRISDANRAQGRVLTSTADHLSADGVANSRFLPTGTVIMSICATIGIPVITGFDTCIHDGFVSFTRLRGIDREFLLFKLRELEPTFRGLGQTGSQANLNSDLVRGCPVHIPSSLAEQRQIAEVLADFEDAVRALDDQIQKGRSGREAMVRHLFASSRHSWTERLVAEVFDTLRTTNLSRSQLQERTGVGCIHYGDIHTKWSNWLDLQQNLVPKASPSAVVGVPEVRNGDLVVADASEDLAGVGKAVEVVNVGTRRTVAGLHTLLLRPRPGFIAPGFAGLLSETSEYRDQMRTLATGLKVFGISKRNLANVAVRLPDLETQERIVATVRDVDAHQATLRHRRDKLHQVRQSAARELLSGTVRLS